MMLHLAVLSFGFLAAPSQAKAPDVAGEWEATYETPGGPRTFKILFQVKGDSLSGLVKRSDGDVPLVGKISGDEITFRYTITYNNDPLNLTIAAKVAGDTMTGTVDFGGMAQEEFSARRVRAP